MSTTIGEADGFDRALQVFANMLAVVRDPAGSAARLQDLARASAEANARIAEAAATPGGLTTKQALVQMRFCDALSRVINCFRVLIPAIWIKPNATTRRSASLFSNDIRELCPRNPRTLSRRYN
jgi:hypothetical protein